MATFMRRVSGKYALALVYSTAAIGPAQAQLAPPPPKVLPSIKAPPPLTATPVAAAPKPGWCEDDCLLAPGAPKPIELLAGERASSAFAVTQPGALRIELRATGVPLVLSVRRPDGRMVEREGSGAIVIDDSASAADIARGVLWGVSVRVAKDTPPSGTGVPRAVAKGSLSVQHPAADKAAVSAALGKAAAAAKLSAAAQPSKPAAPAVDVATQAKLAQAAYDKQVALRHAAQLTQLKATVPSAALVQMDQRIGLRLQGQTLQQSFAAVPLRPLSAAAPSTSTAPTSLAMPVAVPAKSIKGGLLTPAAATGSTQAAATGGAAPVGGGGATAQAAPAPVLATSSAAEGDPGMPLTLGGSHFGDAPGEVRFIVGNGRDIPAPVTFWSAAQVVTEVPYADGIPVYDGHVYLKRGDGTKSALRAFRFLPLYDVTEIAQSGRDWFLAPSIVNIDADSSARTGHPTHSGGIFWGFAGNDKFYLNSQLRNGWVVSSARLGSVYSARPGYSGAYLVDSRVGTTSPYVEVRWWVDAAVGIGGTNEMSYSVRIEAKRPKNLPCAASPCPVL